MKTIFTTNKPLKMSGGKRTRSCAVLLLLCTVLVLSGATNETNKNSFTCALHCEVPHGKTETKCTLMADPLKMNCSSEVYSSILRNVSSLDLSNNNLTQIPSWMFQFCKSLTKLSLAHNRIKTIEPGTFTDLKNLRSLNLSFNNVREWGVGINELQSLNYVDVTDNEHWLPSEQLLQLKNLTTVQGVTWTKYCDNCSLVKIKGNADHFNSTSESMCWRYDKLSSPSEWPWPDHVQYGKAFNFIKLGFWPTCLCDDACVTHQHDLPYNTATYDVTLKAALFLYVTGCVTLLLNITVILVIVFHKSLRGDLAVWLILNIAVCDVLIGLFSVLCAKPVTLSMDNISGSLKVFIFRDITGPILTCALLSEICGSFISTLEKFLKIVYAMKPNIRIGKRGVIVFLFVSWSLSLTCSLYSLQFKDGIDLTWMHELQGLQIVTNMFAAVLLFLLLIIQVVSLALYVPIFIVVKKSAANVGIKREATIAKKIALLVFTNLILFVAPTVFFVFFSNYVFSTSLQVTFTKHQWLLFASNVLPVLCVSINSVLNPCLYALRHPKIKQQLKKIVSRCRTVLTECSVALGEHVHCLPNTVQHENNMEMQEPA